MPKWSIIGGQSLNVVVLNHRFHCTGLWRFDPRSCYIYCVWRLVLIIYYSITPQKGRMHLCDEVHPVQIKAHACRSENKIKWVGHVTKTSGPKFVHSSHDLFPNSANPLIIVFLPDQLCTIHRSHLCLFQITLLPNK